MRAPIDPTIAETRRLLHHSRVVARLVESELYRSYREIFQASTGLPLELQPVGDYEISACRGSVNQNRFCRLLNQGDSGCGQCLMAQRCLGDNQDRGVRTIACFAGLQETVIPIMLGPTMVAQLKTGQIFHDEPAPVDFQKIAGFIETDGPALEEAYLATPVIEKRRYQAMVTLLAAFSLQLTKLANQIGFEEEHEAESFIGFAKDYIEDNLSDPISLEDISHQMQLSPFHFCRKFKKSTGTTLTGYITGRRVELAKEALITRSTRVTEIAFNVGFQSLSQFNRSFQKVMGMSPSEYRKRVA